jgi:hypothetical protein
MPLKLLLSPLNQKEDHPECVPSLQVARTLSLARNFPFRTIAPVWQTTDGPDCVQPIFPRKALGPPAPTTFHVPAAVIGDGGRTLLPTNERFAGRPLYPHVNASAETPLVQRRIR